MKRAFKHNCLKTIPLIIALSLLVLLFSATLTQAQDNQEEIQRLHKRIDSLSTKVHKNSVGIKKNRDTMNVHTRRYLESSKHGGIVIGDLDGANLTIGGFIQADFIHDFKEIDPAAAHKMQPSYIPANNGSVGSTAFSPRQSRINFRSSLPIGDKTLKTLLEFDLFNPNGSSTPRLRHAWAEYGRWGFGQYWSNWMDIDTWPNLFDYWGPNSMIFSRTTQLRYTQPLGNGTNLRLSLEDPGSDILVPDSIGKTLNQIPNMTATLRKDWKQSHLQLSGVAHPINYKTSPDNQDGALGWGAALYGLIYVSKLDNIAFQASYGNGISYYSEDISGLGYDAKFNANKKLDLLPYMGAFLFYDHFWSEKLSTCLGWSYLNLQTKSYQPGSDIQATSYGAINLMYYVNSFLKVGPEFLYGSRQNKDGAFGDDYRVSFSGNLKF